MPVSDVSSYRGLFIETATDHIRAINSLLVNERTTESEEEIYRHLHSLKGSASVMGYLDIVELCNKASNQKDFDELGKIVNLIEDNIKKLA